jgi:hypothetical protein
VLHYSYSEHADPVVDEDPGTRVGTDATFTG